MTTTLIINDAPYGNERTWNALRLALIMQRKPANHVRVFLTGDAVTGALKNQKLPEGMYNIGAMLEEIARKGEVITCITCQRARGLTEDMFVPGVKAGSTVTLAEWVETSDKVLVF